MIVIGNDRVKGVARVQHGRTVVLVVSPDLSAATLRDLARLVCSGEEVAELSRWLASRRD